MDITNQAIKSLPVISRIKQKLQCIENWHIADDEEFDIVQAWGLNEGGSVMARLFELTNVDSSQFGADEQGLFQLLSGLRALLK